MRVNKRMIIKAENLVKRYKSINVVDHLNIEVRKGEMSGLFGPAGSGKTSALLVLQSLIPFQKGYVELFGKHFQSRSIDIKYKTGYVPAEPSFYAELTVYQNVDYFCGLYVTKKQEREALVLASIQSMGLREFWKFYPHQLSEGLLRRLNIACSVAHKPELIFWDEPSEGADLLSSRLIMDYMIKLNQQGITILYATHQADEVEKLSGKIYLMDRGKCLAEGTKEQLKEMIGIQEKITIEVYHLTDDILEELKGLPNVCDVNYYNRQLTMKSQNGKHNLVNILNFLQEKECSIGCVYSERPTLNDVFLEITGKEWA